MKKITLIIIIALITFLGLSAFTFLVPIDKESGPVKGWFLAGSQPASYEINTTTDLERPGKVGCIKSNAKNIKGFGTLMQMTEPGIYKGKRVKMSAFVKTENISDICTLWFRVDGDNGKVLSFDNMDNRPIKGTTPWRKYDIVLDVPDNSIALGYGLIISGAGTSYIDNLTFEIVDNSVPTTGTISQNKRPSEPINLNFEE
jgi:hypothetical protein